MFPTPRDRRGLAVVAVLVLAALTACSSGGSAGRSTTTSDRRPSSPSPSTSRVEVATDIYVAGYPLVVSMRTFQRLGGLLGVNHLFWQNALAGPESRFIVAPNRDTLYSVAVVDLRSEPMALTMPAIGGRYFTYQFLDAWTESFAYVGTRATGGRAGTWVLTPPGWKGTLPAGAKRISSPTNQVFLLGRFLADGPSDIAKVTALSKEVRLQPLSALTGADPAPAPPLLGQPLGTPQDIATDASFFDELQAAVAVNPPTTPKQRALFTQARRRNIVGAGAKGAPARPGLLTEAARAGDRRIERAADSGNKDGPWSVPAKIGTYGDDLLSRAAVARIGWGANVPEEAIYSIARTDSGGDALDGRHTYSIRFPAGHLPPVKAFWSMTVYGPDRFLVANRTGRYSIGDRTPGLALGKDGSLTLVLSTADPGAGSDGRTPNWLPVPKGAFNLMLRLYLPDARALEGRYRYPEVEQVS